MSARPTLAAATASTASAGSVLSGTENVAGAVGLAVAAEAALSRLAESARHMEAATDGLFARVRAASCTLQSADVFRTV